MNLLCNCKGILTVGNRHFAFQTIASLHQFCFYSTKTTDSIPKTVQLTRPKIRRSSGASSFCKKIKEQTGALTVWPKPSGIPYQAKIANFVNLMGYVKSPSRFEAAADGKHFTSVLISPESGGRKNESLLIPVLFEGDLAHVVAYHVKENDFVFVSGPLSAEPLGFAYSERYGTLHVVAENLNYVVGSVSGNNMEGEFGKPGIEKIVEGRKVVENDLSLIVQQLMDQVKDLSAAKNDNGLSIPENDKGLCIMKNDKVLGVQKTDRGFGVPKKDKGLDVQKNFEGLVVSPDKLKMGSEAESSSAVVEAKLEKGDEESGKETKSGEELWRDLMINPQKWWDYREHKTKRLVKEKFPDFKHKETNEALWLNRAPSWALHGITKLVFDVKFMKSNPVQGGTGSGGVQGRVGTGGKKNECKNDDLWKDLVENPLKWWDNRLNKRSSKYPDFRHKEMDGVLWMKNAPAWVISKLPPSKEGKNSSSGYKSR